ncbi:SUN domain-containing protein 2-like [Fopius arisanus]|uniref:SUN domain-containing protein 2-like n=1 Tax=Fopius arisanus TaxID=64838 RepID=A0A9R1SWD7_9HYME|nr:PREDICTED: SUN domain-containing protein 2-like [Fopius arisanus]
MEVKNVIELRDELQNRIREISSVMPKMSEAISKLRNEVSEDFGAETSEKFKDVVRREIQTYDADKTGRTDYALEAAGGSIVSTRNTEPYSTGASVLSLFGMPLCHNRNTPRTVIQTGALPGECWAFKGSTGSVVIELLGSVYISGITLEHISPSISPTGETSTAPRDFSLWGLKHKEDTEGILFGEFTYDNCNSPVQYFKVENPAKDPYEVVEVKIHSNSGSPDYTCIYRIRVHGTLNRLNE